MILILFNCITLLSIFVTLILILFFFITKKGEKISNIFISAILILFELQIFFAFSISNYDGQYFIEYHKILILLKQFGFLTGPILYFYIKSFHIKTISVSDCLKHTIPFSLALMVTPIFFFGKEHFILWESPIHLYSSLLIFLHNLIYIILSIHIIRKTGKSLKEILNELKRANHYSWLQYILFGYIVLWIINVNSLVILMIVRKAEWCAYTGGVFALASFLFVNFMIFLILLKPEIYYVFEKYKGNKLSLETKNEYLQRFTTYIEKNKPYLLPEISLESLAQETGLHVKTLSQLINEAYNTNFNSYINGLRMKECIKQLSDPSNQKTILEILYEAGFNSKSSFYAKFKEYTDHTPLEFRASNKKKV
jgi:AraC-like DNA-binding protein